MSTAVSWSSPTTVCRSNTSRDGTHPASTAYFESSGTTATASTSWPVADANRAALSSAAFASREPS
ncbi:hypothetical protein C441_09061 [Haloferax sulfurifontis ATCC BAA-897]|uniref:Uncharacterized protein n=1 Tax=Haloferax sulfurifontis ATCC BAA-897 TaxID=662480 RepID=M0ICS1_9EURY|nr:hypothetical protein [Haloferax sulfurifontis]ELZ93653.1 hypothetical protein C441_09061 [Haloferax sulfurifontis ATCC BAA-897]